MIECYHIAGMLDRDQRTIKSAPSVHPRVPDEGTNRVQSHHHHQHHQQPRPQCHHTSSHPPPPPTKTRYLRTIFTRLKQVVIVGIYLLSVVSLPCSLSAPATLLNMDERLKSHPKWIKPCGMDAEDQTIPDSSIQIPAVPDQVLIAQIISQATTALAKANQFKENYAERMFNTNFEQLHKNWKDTRRYSWLPSEQQIPKSLNEALSEEYLKTLTFSESLLNTYKYLQMVAVGLEQVVWDQEDREGVFLDNFNESEYNLRLVLCEIQMAIFECNLHPHADVGRDIMPTEIRQTKDNTSTNLRDWIIYRDYMNVLEYIIQVFEYLKNEA